MSSFRWDRHSCLSAFTVVEMLIVVAIMMLLLAMLLPLLDKIRRQAQVTAQKADFAAIAAALDAYKNDFGWYPFGKDQQQVTSLGDFLMGGRPDYGDGASGSGIRVAKDNTNPTAQVAVGRVYGPYLPPAKWRIMEHGYAGGSGGCHYIMDRWGGPIIYMPRRMKPSADANILSGRYGNTGKSLLNGILGSSGQFDYMDGWTDYDGAFCDLGIALAFLVRMGDDDSSGRIDLAAGERLRYDGPYVLISGGPDGADRFNNYRGQMTFGWGFEDFDANNDNNVDEPMVDMSRPIVNGVRRYCIREEARKRIDKSDDIYNFER